MLVDKTVRADRPARKVACVTEDLKLENMSVDKKPRTLDYALLGRVPGREKERRKNFRS